MKFRIISIILILTILGNLISCTQASDTAQIEPDDIVVDPFAVEDNLVDRTDDIVLDFYTLLNQWNTAHKEVTKDNFSRSEYSEYMPSFHDSLNLVSKEEAKALLTTKRNHEGTCTKENALTDVELLFRLFKSFYGPYAFFGGDEVFFAARERIEETLNSMPDTFTVIEYSHIIMDELTFITDRHMDIGIGSVCEYNNIKFYDFYVKDLYFYEDGAGFFTKINDRKWYLSQVGPDSKYEDYLRITIDQNGQLCYMLCFSGNAADPRQNIEDITLIRGDRVEALSIVWENFEPRKYLRFPECISVKNNIPLLEVGMYEEAKEQDAQTLRVQKIGKMMLKHDVMILDIVSGSGWDSFFSTIPHSLPDLALFKFSNTARYLGRTNMPWGYSPLGTYYARNFTGKWGKNDSLVFIIQDQTNFSALEGNLGNARTVENVVTVGGSTGGTAGPSSATGQVMVLPNTGLQIAFGATLSIVGGYSEDGYCYEPDIWVAPTEASDFIYRLCSFYGIENSKDASGLETEDLKTPVLQALEIAGDIFANSVVDFNLKQYTSVEFQYDLDNNGQLEDYVFGVSFADKKPNELKELETLTLSNEDIFFHTVLPTVWRKNEDGTLTKNTAFCRLLTNQSTTISCVSDPSLQPNVLEPATGTPWKGGIYFEIPPSPSVWVYEVSATLGDQQLIAHAATTILTE